MITTIHAYLSPLRYHEWSANRSSFAVSDSTQTWHTKNIQTFHYNRTLSSSLTIVGRGCRGRNMLLYSSSTTRSQANEQKIDPFPDLRGLKRLQEILHEQSGCGHARFPFSWLPASAHVATRRPLQLFRLVAVLFKLHRHTSHAQSRTSVLLQQTIADARTEFAITPQFAACVREW